MINPKAVKAMIAELREEARDLHVTYSYGTVYTGRSKRLSSTADMLEEMLRALSSSEDGLPPMPPTVDRRLFDDRQPNLGMESDQDWARNNFAAIEWLADHHKAIRAALLSRETKDEAPDTLEDKR